MLDHRLQAGFTIGGQDGLVSTFPNGNFECSTQANVILHDQDFLLCGHVWRKTFLFNGSRTSNVDPWAGEECTVIVPPCSRTRLLTMVRPRPIPGTFARRLVSARK